jgi:4'-phosphopantetheinyl transferase
LLQIEASTTIVNRFHKLLSPEERERTSRFRFGHLKDSFILARGALRVLLGHYARISPPAIEFSYGPKGKPSIAGNSRLKFSLSHSNSLALFAFTLDCEIGIDLEYISPTSNILDIADRFFCHEEAAELMSLPIEQRTHAFFLCWTRKEAYIKATGEGLSEPLDRFRVSLRPGEAARLVHLGHDTNAAALWALHDLTPNPYYAAALAYRDEPRPVEILPPLEPVKLLNVIQVQTG